MKKNLFNWLKVIGTFRSECTPKFEHLKNKRKFKPLKANELKFVPLKSNFPKSNSPKCCRKQNVNIELKLAEGLSCGVTKCHGLQ